MSMSCISAYLSFWGQRIFLAFVGFLFSIPFLVTTAIKTVMYGPKEMLNVKDRPLPPKMLISDKWGQHNYVYLPGLKMHYVELGNRDKPLMLFLHGFPEFWFSWRHQLKHFSDRFWCVAPDLRGYGDTEKPVGLDQYSLDILAADVKNLIKALGKQRCILVGHDWGGAVGFRVCQQYPELITAYIACNGPHIAAWKKGMTSSWVQFLMSFYVLAFQCPFIPEIYLRLRDHQLFDRIFYQDLNKVVEKEGQDVIEAYKFTFKGKDALTGPINYYRNLPLLFTDGLKNIDARIRVPILAIYGQNDKYLSQSTIEGTGILASSFILKNIPSAGHFVQMEVPEEVNQLMEDYISKLKI